MVAHPPGAMAEHRPYPVVKSLNAFVIVVSVPKISAQYTIFMRFGAPQRTEDFRETGFIRQLCQPTLVRAPVVRARGTAVPRTVIPGQGPKSPLGTAAPNAPVGTTIFMRRGDLDEVIRFS